MNELWDAIIVGAGPAGASAAYFLGEKGLRALVLEREALPREKPCGGAVPRSALSRFPFGFEPVIEGAVTTVRCAWQEAEKTIPIPDASVLMVRRREFDAYLISRAQAEVIDRTRVVKAVPQYDRVTVSAEDGRTWAGRYLLLADGCASALARGLGLGLRRAGIPTLAADVPLSQVKGGWRGCAWLQFGALPGGYLWAFPKREHLSVGIVDFRRRGRPLRGIFEAEMARMGISLDGVHVRGYPLPVYAGRQAVGRGRVLLLGDAAGLVDPFIGEGIRYALHSGQVAAKTVAAGELAEAYARRVAREMLPSLARAREVAALFYRFPRLAYNVATYDQRGAEWVTGVLSEAHDYLEARIRLPALVAGYFIRQARARLRPGD
jgi:geranylgeranyl reductase family protein